MITNTTGFGSDLVVAPTGFLAQGTGLPFTGTPAALEQGTGAPIGGQRLRPLSVSEHDSLMV